MTEHAYGELYTGQHGQRRYVLTPLHKGCGGQAMRADTDTINWKMFGLKPDGTVGCCKCGKQPILPEEVYEDYR